MTMKREIFSYDDEAMGFFPVMARKTAEATRYLQLDQAFTTSSAGAIRGAVKIFAPGFFAGSIPGSTRSRLLPRTFAAAALASAATSLTVKFNTAGIFIPGDILSIIPPSGRVNVQSATTGWAIADTVTVTINGVAVVYTLIAADIGGSLAATNQLVADKVFAAVRANPYVGRRVDGRTVVGASGSVDIVFWSVDFVSNYTLVAADTGANGTVTAVTATFAPLTTIGTISAVNTITNVLTIGAAAISVPNGFPIGVATSSPADLGLLSPGQPIDLLFRESQNYAAYTEIIAYRNRLPYFDGELAFLFPEITLV
jgi:hypothetical protein